MTERHTYDSYLEKYDRMTARQKDKYAQKTLVIAAKKGGAGGRKAVDMLIACNAPLLYKTCRSYLQRAARDGKTLDDLFQTAVEGIIDAIRRFNPRCETAFMSYAIPVIEHTIQRDLDNAGDIRIPSRKRQVLWHAEKISAEEGCGMTVAIRKAAVQDGMTSDIDGIIAAWQATTTVQGDSRPCGDDSPTILETVSSGEPFAPGVEAWADIERFLAEAGSILSREELDMEVMRRGLDGMGARTLTEAGIELGYPKDGRRINPAVRRIWRNAEAASAACRDKYGIGVYKPNEVLALRASRLMRPWTVQHDRCDKGPALPYDIKTVVGKIKEVLTAREADILLAVTRLVPQDETDVTSRYGISRTDMRDEAMRIQRRHRIFLEKLGILALR